VPDTDCTVGALEALLLNVRLADVPPVAAGANVTVNEVLLPAAIVIGKEAPVTENSDPLTPTAVTVTEAPLALRFAVCCFVVPTTTLPKLMLDGFTASWPGAVAVPLSVTERFGLEASEVIAIEPVALPAVLGAHTTLNVKLCPAAKESGGVIPLTVKSPPLAATAEIFTNAPPVLVSVSDNVLLLPTCTLPKVKEVGIAARVPGVIPVPDRETFNVGFDALLVNVTYPVALPDDEGEYITVKVVL
jgi:hypothetical protein